ncbi:hypothetical protein DTO164E3_8545 [Paecilomyces variotii]|nr:hypothetical protein DTO164E3_8545 [Paecilomyces variotii]KAJ9403341.1 hypothetical protein DTO045G8_8912 [Paecilomyces variotii]
MEDKPSPIELHPDYKYCGRNFTTTTHHDTYPAISPLLANLSGQTVLVTGASRGIGATTAAAFARAGASQIVILARGNLDGTEKRILDEAAATGRYVPEILKLHTDITDAKAVAAAANEIRARFGKVNILVNNAAFLGKEASITESDPDEWWRSWEVNNKGTYLVTREILPLLFAAGDGQDVLRQVVNLTSISAHLGWPGHSSYTTTKLAVIRFTERIYAEYADKGVISIALHPGLVATDMGETVPENMRPYFGDTQDLSSDTVVWLTKKPRRWLAGRYVDATWDMLELEEKKDTIVENDLLKVRMRLSAD